MKDISRAFFNDNVIFYQFSRCKGFFEELSMRKVVS